LHQLAASPVLAILRGLDPDDAVRQAEMCWAAGVALVEVSLSDEAQLATVRAVCERARQMERLAGAGTVVKVSQLHAAAEVGAAFAVAPGLAPELVAAAAELGMPYLPGIATPSEAQAAFAFGFRTLKLFPAAQLGIGFMRALAGPFPELRFVAVGGISAVSAEEWVAAGAVGVGIGTGLEANTLPELLARLGANARS
jgi:2-dehydro-3-deoxyphosphogluconate aldolase/(4S)-4-hydroxy-2-oxoglutarate aldolase